MTTHGPSTHPNDELLAGHVSGWIPWAADLCVRVHLEGCARCRGAVTELEAAQSAFVDALPEAPMAPGALEALIARLEATPAEPPAPSGPETLGDVALPAALRGLGIRRRRWLLPGVWVAHVPGGRAAGWRTYVLRAPAGQKLPPHAHGGRELLCVLSGTLVDGGSYEAGDFVESAKLSTHSVAAAADGPCACLIAAEGPIRSDGLAGLISRAASI